MRLALVQRLIAHLLGRETGIPADATAAIRMALDMEGQR